MARLIAILIVAPLVVAPGCLTQKPPVASGTRPTLSSSSMTTTSSASTNMSKPVVPPIPWDPVKLENCTGTIGTMEVPRSHVRPEVPDVFDLGGIFQDTSTVDLDYYTCSQVANRTMVESDKHFLHVRTIVEAPKEWSSGNLSFYVLDVRTDSLLLAHLYAAVNTSFNRSTFSDTTVANGQHAVAVTSPGSEFQVPVPAIRQRYWQRGLGAVHLLAWPRTVPTPGCQGPVPIRPNGCAKQARRDHGRLPVGQSLRQGRAAPFASRAFCPT